VRMAECVGKLVTIRWTRAIPITVFIVWAGVVLDMGYHPRGSPWLPSFRDQNSTCPPLLGGARLLPGAKTFEDNTHKSQLSGTIQRALTHVLREKGPGLVCVMEVGTATGTGTTVRLVEALDELCVRTGRGWKVIS